MPEISRFLGIVIGMFYRDMARRTFTPCTASTRRRSTSRAARSAGTFHLERSGSCENGHSSTERSSWRIGAAPDCGSRWSASPRWSSDMDYHVLDARHVRDHIVWLRFRDGAWVRLTWSSNCTVGCSSPCATWRRFEPFASTRNSTRSCGRMALTSRPSSYTTQSRSRPNTALHPTAAPAP